MNQSLNRGRFPTMAGRFEQQQQQQQQQQQLVATQHLTGDPFDL